MEAWKDPIQKARFETLAEAIRLCDDLALELWRQAAQVSQRCERQAAMAKYEGAIACRNEMQALLMGKEDLL